MDLRKKLDDQEFPALFQLTSQAVNYETIFEEENQKKICCPTRQLKRGVN